MASGAAALIRALCCYVIMDGYADKIRQMRLAAGKSEKEMAELIGINLPSYYDLESYDDEVLDCLSLYELKKMGQVLKIAPVDLLSDEANNHSGPNHLPFAEFIETVKKYIASAGITVAEFEVKAGWEMEGLLNNPEEIGERNVQFLKDVCGVLGINWLSVVPE
jgi:DNA-binding XRE family transcriptional regulator